MPIKIISNPVNIFEKYGIVMDGSDKPIEAVEHTRHGITTVRLLLTGVLGKNIDTIREKLRASVPIDLYGRMSLEGDGDNVVIEMPKRTYDKIVKSPSRGR